MIFVILFYISYMVQCISHIIFNSTYKIPYIVCQISYTLNKIFNMLSMMPVIVCKTYDMLIIISDLQW